MINCICSIKTGIYICCRLNIKMILKLAFSKLPIRPIHRSILFVGVSGLTNQITSSDAAYKVGHWSDIATWKWRLFTHWNCKSGCYFSIEFNIMVKHCSYGTCKSDSRYPEKLMGAKFIPFPKPKSDLEKCLRWISCCRRPHAQLNVDKITKHTYVCSKVSTRSFYFQIIE